jgi:Uma2 family endonuclease
MTAETVRPAVPPLVNGERLTQAEFHRRYEAAPRNVKAELVGGVVHLAAAAKMPHSLHQGLLVGWANEYWMSTPGTQTALAPTTILGDDSEPEPDVVLRIEGGQSRVNDRQYLEGPPEFVAEVSDTTARLDLNAKRADYERHGVLEYLVLVIPQRRAVWFAREDEQFVELAPDEDGLLRSRVFPGLWLDADAFFRLDGRGVRSALEAGLAATEHAEFVERLKP